MLDSTDPDQLRATFWRRLTEATEQTENPLRLATLATIADSGPSARIVVVRQVDQDLRTLIFYTDVRSAKVSELKKSPAAQILFYDPAEQLQFRLSTSATVITSGSRVTDAWNALPASNRQNYATELAPGIAIINPDTTMLDSSAGKQHFAIISAVISQIEILQLRRQGHRRARFIWQSNHWQFSWLVP